MSSTWATYNWGSKYFGVGNYSDDCYFPQTTIKMIQITTSLSLSFSKFFPTNIIYKELEKWLQPFNVSMHCFEMPVTCVRARVRASFKRRMYISFVKILFSHSKLYWALITCCPIFLIYIVESYHGLISQTFTSSRSNAEKRNLCKYLKQRSFNAGMRMDRGIGEATRS